ncbi:hypothetical protein ACIRVF_30485 [Kitasatospora sp. NPDC101157]|uniref:hypothetical protein n=1 Tax=Kitasatospora sp. NPDC101157 TaxID=3364098 RepID=UPI0037F7241C
MTSVPGTAELPASTVDPAGLEPVAEYVTGLQTTNVLRAADGTYRWWQRPGPLAGEPPTATPFPSRLPDAPGAARLALPRPTGDGLLYQVPGPASAAAWLRDFRPAARLLVASALASVARGLRALHRSGPPAPERSGPPPALLRLRSWAASDDESRGRAEELWGRRRTVRLLDWADEAAGTTATAGAELPAGPVHGWASLGALVPPLRAGRTALLTGPDLGTGRPELDLGWTLGELAELHWRLPSLHTTPDPNRAPSSPPALARVFLDAYGPGPDPVLLGRCAVLRIAVHLQDFARHQGWHDELLDYFAFTADLIDQEGRPALPPELGDHHHDPA